MIQKYINKGPLDLKRVSEQKRNTEYWHKRWEKAFISARVTIIPVPEHKCLGAVLEFTRHSLTERKSEINVGEAISIQNKYDKSLSYQFVHSYRDAFNISREGVTSFSLKYLQNQSIQFYNEPAVFKHPHEMLFPLLGAYQSTLEGAAVISLCGWGDLKSPTDFIGHTLAMCWSTDDNYNSHIGLYDGATAIMEWTQTPKENHMSFFSRIYGYTSDIVSFAIKGEEYHHEEISFFVASRNDISKHFEID